MCVKVSYNPFIFQLNILCCNNAIHIFPQYTIKLVRLKIYVYLNVFK